MAATYGWRMAVSAAVETIGIANGWTSVDEGKWNDLQLGSEGFAVGCANERGYRSMKERHCRCFRSMKETRLGSTDALSP